NIAPGTHRLGVMLAYTPLHQLLLEAVRARSGEPPVLVMTSANRSEEPIIAERAGLYRELGRVFDLCLDHDRPIANRCDDSVVMAGDPERAPLFIRRARGYAPQPIVLGPTFHVKQPVLALGGELRGCFCLARGNRAWLSPHVGSLESAGSERFFSSTLDRYRRWTGVEPALVACDLHPDYLSTRLAEKLAEQLAVPLVRVQHHLAHALSVLAEHDIPGPALAVGLDGTGYGTDGRIWGCELLVVRPDRSWSRVGHLGELALVEAGDALPDPSRVAAGFLAQALGRVPPGLGLARSSRSAGARVASGRPVPTTSLGRLFDAVAAITGACRHATFEGQAPAALEALADPRARGGWPVRPARGPAGELLLDPCPILRRVAAEMLAGVAPALVAARFHETVCRGLARMAIAACREHELATVVISGGSLANTLLRNRLPVLLRRAGLEVRRNELVPANDGGISLGQAVAAGR
ncbi:carbamoyltransferase HypF, partial [candidate division WOR-3 bacterium]|nr:carbamoyltransferase HypF [candidate division WOR-3 bacterium]